MKAKQIVRGDVWRNKDVLAAAKSADIRLFCVAYVTQACSRLFRAGDVLVCDAPIRATGLRYYFKAPESTKPEILEYIKAGGHVPYLGQSDLTDNLNKGLIDVCKGHIFEDDSQIWWVSGSMKLYGLEDHIELEFEETPDIINIKGVACNVDSDKVQIDRDSLI